MDFKWSSPSSSWHTVRMLRAVLKDVPSWWSMFQIGMVCPSKKRAFLKHVSNWHCENFVISKPRVKWKVVKHKIVCKETKSTTKLHLFIYFSVINVGLLQIQWVILLTALDKTKFARCHLKNVSEMHIFQNGTLCQSVACFRMAHVSERHATHTLSTVSPLSQNSTFQTKI